MRYFKSQECYNRHKETVGNTKSIFESLVKCTKCQKVVKRNLMRPESHNCRLVRCTVCQKYMNIETHQCYLQPERTRASETADSDDMFDSEADENSNDSSYNQLLFFDFECIQESGVHVPNLCVVQDEAGIEHVFKVEIRKMTFVSGCFRKKIVVAHNFQGHDGYYILQYLHKNGIVPEVIMHGAKLLTIYVQC